MGHRRSMVEKQGKGGSEQGYGGDWAEGIYQQVW